MEEENKKKEKKDNTFIYKNDKGEEVECRVLFTFDSDETKKSYIIYTDETIGEDGRPLAYASSYDPTGASDELFPIESEKEWDLIYTVYENLQKKENEENDG